MKNFSPKLYTNVSVYSLQHGIEQEYRLWVLMRSYVQIKFGNQYGSTKVHQLTHVAMRAMLTEYNISRQVYYKFIANNTGTFFNISDKYVTFKSLSAICKQFNILPGHCYRINIDKLINLDSFRAYCFYGYYANELNYAMKTREQIQRDTNICKVSQLKYEEIIGLNKFYNYFLIDPNGFNNGIDIPETVLNNNAWKTIKNVDSSKELILFQTSNTYLSYVNGIQLFNDKEVKRIYKAFGVRYNTAYRKNYQLPQSGGKTDPNGLIIRLLECKSNNGLRGLLANEMDEYFINDYPYLQCITANKYNVRVFFLCNYDQAVKHIQNIA